MEAAPVDDLVVFLQNAVASLGARANAAKQHQNIVTLTQCVSRARDRKGEGEEKSEVARLAGLAVAPVTSLMQIGGLGKEKLQAAAHECLVALSGLVGRSGKKGENAVLEAVSDGWTTGAVPGDPFTLRLIAHVVSEEGCSDFFLSSLLAKSAAAVGKARGEGPRMAIAVFLSLLAISGAGCEERQKPFQSSSIAALGDAFQKWNADKTVSPLLRSWSVRAASSWTSCSWANVREGLGLLLPVATQPLVENALLGVNSMISTHLRESEDATALVPRYSAVLHKFPDCREAAVGLARILDRVPDATLSVLVSSTSVPLPIDALCCVLDCAKISLNLSQKSFLLVAMRPIVRSNVSPDLIARLLTSLARYECCEVEGGEELVEWAARHASVCESFLFHETIAKNAFPRLLDFVTELSVADAVVCCEAMSNSIVVHPREHISAHVSRKTFAALLLMAAEESGRPVLQFLELVCQIPPVSNLYSTGDREAFFAAFTHMILHHFAAEKTEFAKEVLAQVRECKVGSFRRWIGVEISRLLVPEMTETEFGPPEKSPEVEIDQCGAPEASEEAFGHLS